MEGGAVKIINRLLFPRVFKAIKYCLKYMAYICLLIILVLFGMYGINKSGILRSPTEANLIKFLQSPDTTINLSKIMNTDKYRFACVLVGYQTQVSSDLDREAIEDINQRLKLEGYTADNESDQAILLYSDNELQIISINIGEITLVNSQNYDESNNYLKEKIKNCVITSKAGLGKFSSFSGLNSVGLFVIK